MEKTLIKILTVGDGQVGKTSLLKLLSDDKFKTDIADLKRTVLFDFHVLKFDDECQVIFFDIAGQSNEGIEIAIKEMKRFVLGGVNLIFLMFDINKLESLLNIAKWYEVINNHYVTKNIEQPKIILIGNKSDLNSNVSSDMIMQLLDSNTNFVKYHQTSCVTNDGLDNMREIIHKFIHEGAI